MSSKGLGKPLTTELVFTKTKSDSLHNIKNLNLWGNDLQDLSLIEKMPNLQVISLSVNRIGTLKYFANCHQLQELYLRKNNIPDIKEIKYLLKLPSLKVLWLCDNPCAQIQNYRQIVIKCLPNLIKLDNVPITPQQKAASQKVQFNLGVSNQNSYNTQPQQSHNQSYSQQYKNNFQQQRWQRPNTAQSNSAKKQTQQSSFQQRNLDRNFEKNTSYAQSGNSSNNYQHQSVQQVGEQKWEKKNMNKRPNPQSNMDYVQAQQNMKRNQNILMAILSLMRELDPGSLQIIRRQADKMLDQK